MNLSEKNFNYRNKKFIVKFIVIFNMMIFKVTLGNTKTVIIYVWSEKKRKIFESNLILLIHQIFNIILL